MSRGPPSPSLAELSRNASVISSSSSSSSTSSLLLDARPVRPTRTFAAPRSASDLAHSQVHLLPAYIQRDLGISTPPSSPLRDPSPAPPRPRFNSPHDFEFGDILGHGSYSTVIQATGKFSRRVYAIKVLDKAHLQRHNQTKTAYAEKDALVALGISHPGVVGLHSTFSDAWSLYFVLDLLPNGDLRALITRYGSLSLECTRYYIAQLTDALVFIHGKGVMHRDIKPENLLLDARFRLALADFGTAKVLPIHAPTPTDFPAPTPAPALHHSNTFVGTPQYYSPELLVSSTTSPASDLWALGCVLVELHTGAFAFAAPSPMETWRRIKALHYDLPDAFDPRARDLVTKLLVIQPEDRLGAVGPNPMQALRDHPFFVDIQWDAIWDVPHPPLESGLRPPPEPISAPESDAELGAQLREERLMDQDDDEIAWGKDARIAAYLPGLRHTSPIATSNGHASPGRNRNSSSLGKPAQGSSRAASEVANAAESDEGGDADISDLQRYTFPRVAQEGQEDDGGLPYSAPPKDTSEGDRESRAAEEEDENQNSRSLEVQLAEAVAGTVLQSGSDAKVDEVLSQDAHANENGHGHVPPVVSPVEPQLTNQVSPYPMSTCTPVAIPVPAPKPAPSIPTPSQYAHILHLPEHLLLSSPLVPEAPATSFARLLPRLLSGSLRSKPKLKERVLLLTDRRVLCVSAGKTVATVKGEFALPRPQHVAALTMQGVAVPPPQVKGVELRGEKGLAILSNDKPVVYVLDDPAAPQKWVKHIQSMLLLADAPPAQT
ncbi:hypothetical protein H0H81_000190 [Sphagnurus paluster]|uniref:non-specific serine/threonine protein kinase n=1 Tax=Sphagnurus paluster TaxID=117069 RepID=A0A9P7K640_9AGAR|nr:hypothetical protein H0H81_000190 [Sphagnurus paluster]